MVTCAEGDFHSLAAQLFGELLREHGVGVTVLGASTPAEVVAEFLVRAAVDTGAALLLDLGRRELRDGLR